MAEGSDKIINTAQNYPVSQIFNNDPTNENVYQVPRFQREYSWGKEQWEALYADLLSNQKGYFLGSIITVPIQENQRRLELIDGQQRLATISILMAVIYEFFNKMKDKLNEEENNEVFNLKSRIIDKKTKNPRLLLQRQNHNEEDYQAKLSEIGLLGVYAIPKNAGNRRVFKAYKYFSERIDKSMEDKKIGAKKEFLFDVYERLLAANIISINVSSQANAYILFESLNNRGLPLSAIDIIKNNFLGTIEQKNPGNLDENYDLWNRVLANLGEDATIQERFFRQYLNAFMAEYSDILGKKKTSIIGKSDIISTYGKLISNDAEYLLDKLYEASIIYSLLICRNIQDNMANYEESLKNLQRIKGAPAYILLLYLFMSKNDLKLNETHLIKIIELVTRFFIRRNLTDTPPTRDLDRIFINIINDIEDKQVVGPNVLRLIKKLIKGVAADNDGVRRSLNGPIYEENSDVARYILCMLEKSMRGDKIWKEDKDLWATDDKGKFFWTIEHILPQGQNIPPCWVEMIADGDEDDAQEIRDEYAHTLGNLTLTGYNANLGNKCFDDKKNAKRRTKFIGYRNGLALNEAVVKAKKWTVDKIKARTKDFVDKTMELCKL